MHRVTGPLSRGLVLALAAGLAAPLSAQDAPAAGEPAPLTVDPGPRFVPESFSSSPTG